MSKAGPGVGNIAGDSIPSHPLAVTDIGTSLLEATERPFPNYGGIDSKMSTQQIPRRRREEKEEPVVEESGESHISFCGMLVPEETYLKIWEFLWVFVLASFAANVSFYFPSIMVPDSDAEHSLNFTTVLQNFTGAFTLGVITVLESVKYQYVQKYLFYNGIKSGWSSVWTTFGNYIQDSGRLLFNEAWAVAFLSVFGQLFGAALCWELGRRVALHFYRDAQVAGEMKEMESAQRRMHLEVNKAISSKADHGMLERSYAGRRISVRNLDSTLQRRLRKRIKHQTPFLSFGQRWIFGIACTIAYGSYFLLYGFYDNYSKYNVLFFFSMVWAVSGALVGGYLGDNRGRKNTVQWGTFKVNLISSILIATAYNLLLFKHYLGPVGRWKYFNPLVSYFVTSFCGSESSFAGLIDETMTLFHADIPKTVALKNLMFNLFLCMGVFFVVFSLPRIMLVLQTSGVGTSFKDFF